MMFDTILFTMFVCSIMNSLVIVLFLSGMVAMIMLRTLHKDIARYNQMESAVCQMFIAFTTVALLSTELGWSRCRNTCTCIV